MPWIIFDDEDRRTPAPHFCLESLRAGRVCRDDFCEDCNLVVVFTFGKDCQECRDWLASFTGRQKDYQALEARVLAVLPEPPQALAADARLASLPVTLLSDADGKARQSYTGLVDSSLVSENDTLIYILDTYGAPYSAYIGSDLQDPTLHDDVLKWLEFIGVQCPE